jgi:telomere length regulation protein
LFTAKSALYSGDSYYPMPLLFPDQIYFLVDLLSSELIPRVVRLLNNCLSSNDSSINEDVLESKPEAVFWLRMMESITDPYTTERISEQILHELASQNTNDVQAYWVLWLFFHRIFNLRASVR